MQLCAHFMLMLYCICVFEIFTSICIFWFLVAAMLIILIGYHGPLQRQAAEKYVKYIVDMTHPEYSYCCCAAALAYFISFLLVSFTV